jgi:hypothetical protein
MTNAYANVTGFSGTPCNCTMILCVRFQVTAAVGPDLVKVWQLPGQNIMAIGPT